MHMNSFSRDTPPRQGLKIFLNDVGTAVQLHILPGRKQQVLESFKKAGGSAFGSAHSAKPVFVVPALPAYSAKPAFVVSAPLCTSYSASIRCSGSAPHILLSKYLLFLLSKTRGSNAKNCFYKRHGSGAKNFPAAHLSTCIPTCRPTAKHQMITSLKVCMRIEKLQVHKTANTVPRCTNHSIGDV